MSLATGGGWGVSGEPEVSHLPFTIFLFKGSREYIVLGEVLVLMVRRGLDLEREFAK